MSNRYLLSKSKVTSAMMFSREIFWFGNFNYMSRNIEETYQFLVDHDVKVNALGGEGKTKDGNPLGVYQS